MKLNITTIVQMPEKLCTALNSFFARLHEDEKAKLLRKIGAFLEKIVIYYFYVGAILNLLNIGSGANRKCLPP